MASRARREEIALMPLSRNVDRNGDINVLLDRIAGVFWRSICLLDRDSLVTFYCTSYLVFIKCKFKRLPQSLAQLWFYGRRRTAPFEIHVVRISRFLLFVTRAQMSRVVYKASCWDCQDFYIGKTKRRLHDRKTKHFKSALRFISLRAWKLNCSRVNWHGFGLPLTGQGWLGGGGGEVFRCRTFLSNPREVCTAEVRWKFIYIFTRQVSAQHWAF